ncbi:PHO85 cyclin-5 [Blastocladiella emersonii ATCC 22665]|nr:PHO85 cyclin-5 [Blastocladiella emersonii ATCC 22665]
MEHSSATAVAPSPVAALAHLPPPPQQHHGHQHFYAGSSEYAHPAAAASPPPRELPPAAHHHHHHHAAPAPVDAPPRRPPADDPTAPPPPPPPSSDAHLDPAAAGSAAGEPASVPPAQTTRFMAANWQSAHTAALHLDERSAAAAAANPVQRTPQTLRRHDFVQALVATAAEIIDGLYPTPPTAVIPLSTFIAEILRRSKSSFSTLQLALFYLFKFRAAHLRRIQAAEAAAAAAAIIAARGGAGSATDLPPVLPSPPSLAPTPGAPQPQPPQPQPPPPTPANLRTLATCGRRLFLAALIMAAKYLQDKNYSNRAWSKISGLSALEINRNEREFLDTIDYGLFVSAAKFARWSALLVAHINAVHQARLSEASAAAAAAAVVSGQPPVSHDAILAFDFLPPVAPAAAGGAAGFAAPSPAAARPPAMARHPSSHAASSALSSGSLIAQQIQQLPRGYFPTSASAPAPHPQQQQHVYQHQQQGFQRVYPHAHPPPPQVHVHPPTAAAAYQSRAQPQYHHAPGHPALAAATAPTAPAAGGVTYLSHSMVASANLRDALPGNVRATSAHETFSPENKTDASPPTRAVHTHHHHAPAPATTTPSWAPPSAGSASTGAGSGGPMGSASRMAQTLHAFEAEEAAAAAVGPAGTEWVNPGGDVPIGSGGGTGDIAATPDTASLSTSSLIATVAGGLPAIAVPIPMPLPAYSPASVAAAGYPHHHQQAYGFSSQQQQQYVAAVGPGFPVPLHPSQRRQWARPRARAHSHDATPPDHASTVPRKRKEVGTPPMGSASASPGAGGGGQFAASSPPVSNSGSGTVAPPPNKRARSDSGASVLVSSANRHPSSSSSSSGVTLPSLGRPADHLVASSSPMPTPHLPPIIATSGELAGASPVTVYHHLHPPTSGSGNGEGNVWGPPTGPIPPAAPPDQHRAVPRIAPQVPVPPQPPRADG